MATSKILFSFVKKDILAQKKLNAFFVFNLVLGFLGFLLLQVFQTSLDQQTKDKAQEILGGDIVVSARRVITEQEIKDIENKVNLNFIKKTKTTDFFAMAKFGESTRLVLVRSISDSYPLYGQMKFKSLEEMTSSQSFVFDQLDRQKILIDPELIDQLKIQSTADQNNQVRSAVQQIQLGDASFQIQGALASDPSRTFRMGALAPFVIISENDLSATRLIKPGSTITTSYLYQLADPTQADAYKTLLEEKYIDPSLRFTSALQEDEGGNRVFRYLIDYLGLVSLISIGLSFLCLSYMLNWFFQIQKKTIAIYKILGLTEKAVLKIQILKNLMLSGTSFVIASTMIYFSMPLLQILMTQYFKIDLVLVLSLEQLLISFLVIVLGPQLIAIPSYFSAMNTNPLLLLRQELGLTPVFKFKYLVTWVLTVTIVFWLLAVWQSHSLYTGTFFMGGLLAAALISWIFISTLRKLTALFVNRLNFEFKYSFLSLIRKPGSTDLIFMTMTLSIVVLTLLPHIKKSIIEEVRPAKSSQIPSLFMFDIQMDQKDQLVEIVEKTARQKIELTPLVRSRILKINEENYERSEEQGLFKTRESENEARFRNRGVNLTYKASLQESESLVDGQWFSGSYEDALAKDPNALPEISLEKRYSERIGAKLNDILTFDVQGLEIKAKVTSIRRVRWTSFQPNFFITFQPGVLEEAPQVYLTAVMQLNQDQVKNVQTAVVDQFANISIINVKQSVEGSLVFIDQMALALQVMALLALIVGFFIFIILINTQVGERLNEMNLLQVLGSTTRQIYRMMVQQFSLIAFLSLAVGLALGSIISYVIMAVIFNLGIYYDLTSMIVLIVVLIGLTFLVLKFSMRPLLKLQPLTLLKNEGGMVDNP